MAAEDWPMKEDRIAQTEFVSSFKAASSVYSNSHELPEILNVFQAIAEPLRTRFQYHFTSKRATNRLDKPEWALQHVLALAEQYEGFMANFVQPLLSEALPARGLVASHEFIHALLPMVTTKLQDNTSRLLEDKQLLTYTIAEVKRFDDTMRENFGLCSREGSYWKGVCNEILTKEVFEAWLTSEEDFSMERYHAIMDGVDVFEIVPDTEESTGEIAPNPSASRIIDLFEAMTKTFTPLEDLSQRRKFTQSIQVALLDTYRSRIVSSTDAFEALTSGFSGGFPTTDVAGNSGLQRLCRQLSGVSNVLSRLMDWVNDPYYVAIDDPDTHESCFDRQIQDYTLLKRRIETLIVNHLSNELTQDLRNYTRLQDWASSESQVATIAANSHTSSQLIRFYESIDSMFGYLATVASTVLIHRLYISLGQELDQVIYDSIIKRNEFSRRGALQLKRDILQMWWTFSPYVARPEAGMRSVAESLALLSDGKDSQEAAVLREVEIALDEKTRLSHSTRVEMLEAAGIVTMAPQALFRPAIIRV
ncbi:RINT-1 family protein [Taphrina deformans PYCC 5710]|uniref:RINT-1 family protein n=1 Tax=Taphrina deformans (strain PYCC 5710 / ATCC 11124 / CBS 356.35 / IMI 108563 / JCM 9778 / NBRC 8474) TaxID=1097556 RepID=R4X6U8_TAPDE|nr:RINT-1 family protein [Taphrina deformans PYCC 5710]|eukprot:CCG80676.1 RINT-1 family protein [Taphrina deformans PYCC 5710]